MKKLLAASALVALFATPAFAGGSPSGSDVDVDVDIEQTIKYGSYNDQIAIVDLDIFRKHRKRGDVDIDVDIDQTIKKGWNNLQYAEVDIRTRR